MSKIVPKVVVKRLDIYLNAKKSLTCSVFAKFRETSSDWIVQKFLLLCYKAVGIKSST